MLDILKPPTDNLYKFLALTGTLLLVLSIVLPCYALVTFEIKRLEAVKELSITKAELQESKNLELAVAAAKLTVDAAQHEAEAAIAKTDSIKIKKKISRVTVKELQDSADQLQKASNRLAEASSDYSKKSDAYAQKVESVSRRTIENEYYDDVLETIDEGVFLTKFLLLIGGTVGLLIATWGFALWYRKVQVYEDLALKNTATKTPETEEKSDPVQLAPDSA